MKKIVILLVFVAILNSLSLVFAGTTSFNNDPGLKEGDLWNNKIIEKIEFDGERYIATWKRISEIDDSGCHLIYGGNNDINMFFYSENGHDEDEIKNFGKWVIREMRTEKPYKEFNYNGFYEEEKYACRDQINERQKDVRIGFGNTRGYRAWGSEGINGNAGEVIFERYEKWHFLLFHELGHAYGFGHTNDGSIMDSDGGDHEYRDYQIDEIRNRLI
ncbi:MAG: hypothetical protein WC867_08155 [Candidatus Pacearchaeota archaeon]|jgi:hypothetical protein